MKHDVARKNMVDGQIHTAGVILPGVLEAFETIPREAFVPETLQNIAYNDEDLKVGDSRYLLEPIVHSKMLQALDPKPDDVVLDIGGATGYSAAVLSSLVTTVVALESDKELLKHAEKTWKKLDLQNIVSFNEKMEEGYVNHAPYNLIFINGAVSEVPETLLDQLAPEGRLVTVVREAGTGIGNVTLIQKIGEKQFSSYTVFQAGCNFLPGFEPAQTFSF